MKQRFGCVEYFPAYEIVTDDPARLPVLCRRPRASRSAGRDVRLGEIHRNGPHRPRRRLLPEVEAIAAAAAHRPRNPQSEAHRSFCRRQLERIAALPEIDFRSEAACFPPMSRNKFVNLRPIPLRR